MVSEGTQPRVAIVGMAVLLPGAADLEAYWSNLVAGIDAITDVPAHRWDPAFYDPDGAAGPAQADVIYCRRGGFVDELAEIDPTEFGVMPGSVGATEPDQLIALRVAASAIADAGGEEHLPPRERVGVILGRGGYLTPGVVRLEQRVRGAHQLVRTLREVVPDIAPAALDRVRAAFVEQLGGHDPASAIGLVPNLAASRVANRLDLRGPAYTVDAACASSLVAVDHAVRELADGRCDAVLAGGVHHCHDVTFWSVFAQLRALSPSQRSRPFHRDADGLLIGEGTGVVVLKRLADAERDGDRVYAVIRGVGVASDGKAASLFHPEPAGQALALRRAWEAAGLEPAEPGSLGLLEAHGTATPAGDGAELATLERVFGGADDGRAVIGSVKSMIGHTMPAAGVAGLVKAALAVHRGVLLPTLHCDEPHPALGRTRFRPIGCAEPWELAGGQRVRRAAVNAFGFGGINAHVVLEEHRAQPARRVSRLDAREEPARVLRLSAANPGGIAELLDRGDFTGAASQDGACRLALFDPTPERLALAQKVVARGTPWRGRNDIWFSTRPLQGRIAFVFPGAEAEFEPRVDDVAEHLGLAQPELSAENLGRHAAGIVAVGRLLDRALRGLGIVPDDVAGHSIGEWTAMICAGVYSEAEVDKFIESFDPASIRLPDVAFAALGCGAERVAAAIAERPAIVLSHDNSPNQTIVCGPAGEVEGLLGWFRERSVLGQMLPFRSGFHTPMLQPYLEPIRRAAEQLELHPPKLPIWSATTTAPYPADEAAIRALFVKHLLEPVRFRPLVDAMYADGVRVFVQVGAGRLGSLISDTLRDREHLAIPANSPQRSGMDQLRRVAAALWVEGAAPLPAVTPARPPARPVRLDLSAALVSLGPSAPVLAASGAPAGSLSGLDRLARHSPLADELRALLQDTADTAVAVLDAVRRPVAPSARAVRSVLQVSLDAMPYLRDHCVFRQREDWPDDRDRWPVVPAASLVQHMLGVAELAAPGRRATAVLEARMSRWLEAAPPRAVHVVAVPEGPDRVRVTVGEHAEAVVELADDHPGDAPAPWPIDAAGERLPEITARELYDRRWMFHGPQFQGVTELDAIGPRHIRGTIATPAAPGALLDNAGQLLGAWMMATHGSGEVVFPVGVQSLRLFGAHPPAGARVQCTVRVRSVADDILEADMQLVHDGRVWAQIEGWQDRRFTVDAAVGRCPETTMLSRAHAGGWTVVSDAWTDLASRELIARGQLSALERADYERCSPRARRQWLLGRIAVKDAVRRLLSGEGSRPLFPAEIRVFNDRSGAPRVAGLHGAQLGELAVSLAHCRDVAVGIAARRPTGVGIDVEEIADRREAVRDVALSAAETALLRARAGQADEDDAVWLIRFWTAKEAVAKAEGTGLAGLPRRFEVVAASPTELTVRVHAKDGDGRTYRVRCEQLRDPPRDYVVAWTTDPEPDHEEMP